MKKLTPAVIFPALHDHELKGGNNDGSDGKDSIKQKKGKKQN